MIFLTAIVERCSWLEQMLHRMDRSPHSDNKVSFFTKKVSQIGIIKDKKFLKTFIFLSFILRIFWL
jgi:hypothetical protein